MADLIISVELVPGAHGVNRKLSLHDMYEVVEVILKINPAEELVLLQEGRPWAKSYHIGVKNSDIWNRLNLDSFMNEQYILSTGKTILFHRAYDRYTVVTVKNIPAFWERIKVERIFSQYGVVVGMKRDQLKFSDPTECKEEYKSVWNGDWKIRMKVDNGIPSNMFLDGASIEIYYRGQRRTCFKCGRFHNFRDCDTKEEEYENRFTWCDFPELTTIKIVHSAANPIIPETSEPPQKDESMDETESDGSEEELSAAEEEIVEKTSEKTETETAPAPEIDMSVPITPDHPKADSSMDEISSAPIQTILDKLEKKPKVTTEELFRNITLGEDTIVQVHHSESSQVHGVLASPEVLDEMVLDMDADNSLATDTANTESATEEHTEVVSSILTPGQKINDAKLDNVEATNNGLEKDNVILEVDKDWAQIDSSLSIEGRKRDNIVLQMQSSTEDESDTVKFETGSFVNSCYSTVRSKKSKKDGE